MTRDVRVRLHRIYNIILAVSVVITGALFIYGCLSIYYSGGSEPYSREVVAETFDRICVPVYCSLGLCIVGFIFDFVDPLEEKKKKNRDAAGFAKFVAKLKEEKQGFDDAEAYADYMLQRIEKEKKSRFVWNLVCKCCIAAALAAFIVYAIFFASFSTDGAEITLSIIRAMWVMIPCVAVAVCAALMLVYRNKRSIRAESAMNSLVRQQKKGEGFENDKTEKKVHRGPAVRIAVTVLILVLAVALIVVGALSDGASAVLTKAVNICTECIGLG